jgi:3-deoxy-D-manno-octulosonate 8-phosphate phosphatase (KDO 8-P phosphatase)
MEKHISEASARANNIKIFVMDVDGILTDGKLYFSDNGIESKAFNILDGMGIRMLQKAGIKTAIITGRKTQLVEQRANDLNIDYLIQGCKDKLNALQEILQKEGLPFETAAYIGDDLPDLPAICAVGLGMSVPNACNFVKLHADWISELSGGRGAVREACEFILQAQEKLTAIQEQYL